MRRAVRPDARTAPRGPVLYSGDDAVSGQDLRPRRPPTILRARTDAARRRGPRDHPRLRERDRRPPGRQPRHGRAHRRAAQRAARARRTRSSGTWATSATRTSCSPAAATASARSGSTAASPASRSRAESPHDIVGTGHASTSISYGLGLVEAARIARENDGNVVCVARRRGPHGRGRLRGPQPGRPPAHPARGDPQRQRDVHPRQRRRPAALPQPHPPRPDAHAAARGDRARRRQASRPSAARRTGWARTSRSR